MSDPDNEYAKLPKSDIEVRDVTEEFGPKLARLIASDRCLRTLNFPRLHLPRLAGYMGSDYSEIAKRIRPDGIEVYETRRDSGLGFNGKYQSYGEMNYFVVTPTLTGSPLLSMSTIVHEASHAIQDMKKWRMSGLDNEVDAHFGEALYLVRSGREEEAKNDLPLTRFMIAARQYNADPRYLTSMSFRKFRRDMQNDIAQHYAHMMSIFVEPDLDHAQFHKNFRRKRRWDGIPN